MLRGTLPLGQPQLVGTRRNATTGRVGDGAAARPAPNRMAAVDGLFSGGISGSLRHEMQLKIRLLIACYTIFFLGPTVLIASII